MKTDYFRNLANEMYDALDFKNPTQPFHPLERTLRAIDYCLSYLFSCVLYQGNRQLDYINENGYKEFNSDEQQKFDLLSGELSKRISTLETFVSIKIKQAYIDINIEKKVLFDNIGKHITKVKAEIQKETKNYLTEAELQPTAINEIAETIFGYLALMKAPPQRSQIKKMELRHNFGAALSFLKCFFEIEE